MSCKLVSTLNADGTPDSETYSSEHQKVGASEKTARTDSDVVLPSPLQSPLLDGCDYAMRGKIFRIEPLEGRPAEMCDAIVFANVPARCLTVLFRCPQCNVYLLRWASHAAVRSTAPFCGAEH